MSIAVLVKAENEEAAKDAAFDVDFNVYIVSEDAAACPEIYEFDTHHQICRGNVFSGVLNKLYIEEI